MRRHIPTRIATALLAVALTAAPVAAQQPAGGSVLLVGVGDVDSGQPLAGAQVWLRSVGRLARGNGMGEVTFHGLPRGPMHVTARMIGYEPMDIDVLLSGSDSVEATLLMKRAATSLDTIRVNAAAIPRRLEEFAQRRVQGLGRFLTEGQLDSAGHRDLTTLLVMRFPGLMMRTGLDGVRRILAARASGTMGSMGCEPHIFLDGWPLLENDLDLVRTDELAGVEWYSGESGPIQYRRPGFGCGVMLLWSKW